MSFVQISLSLWRGTNATPGCLLIAIANIIPTIRKAIKWKRNETQDNKCILFRSQCFVSAAQRGRESMLYFPVMNLFIALIWMSISISRGSAICIKMMSKRLFPAIAAGYLLICRQSQPRSGTADRAGRGGEGANTQYQLSEVGIVAARKTRKFKWYIVAICWFFLSLDSSTHQSKAGQMWFVQW